MGCHVKRLLSCHVTRILSGCQGVVARNIRKSAEIPHPEVHEVTCTYLQQSDPGEDFDRYIRIENRLMAPDKCAVFFLDVYSLK